MVELIKETVKKLQRKTKRLEGSGSSVSEQLLETLLQVRRRDHLDQMRLICSIRWIRSISGQDLPLWLLGNLDQRNFGGVEKNKAWKTARKNWLEFRWRMRGKKLKIRTSLAAQWLRHRASKAGGAGLIPCQELRSRLPVQCGRKKKN